MANDKKQIHDAVILKLSHGGGNIWIGIDFYNDIVVSKSLTCGDNREDACTQIAKELRQKMSEKCSCLRCLCAGKGITTFKQVNLSDLDLVKATDQF